jgi:hypothetical protein
MLLTNAIQIVGFLLVAQASPLSVSELLANAERYNRQPVAVIGTISNFRANLWRRRGPIYHFELSDGAETIHVVAFAEPPCQSGTATVEGIFEAVSWRMKGNNSFEEITAHNVTCVPGRVDPRLPKGE